MHAVSHGMNYTAQLLKPTTLSNAITISNTQHLIHYNLIGAHMQLQLLHIQCNVREREHALLTFLYTFE